MLRRAASVREACSGEPWQVRCHKRTTVLGSFIFKGWSKDSLYCIVYVLSLQLKEQWRYRWVPSHLHTKNLENTNNLQDYHHCALAEKNTDVLRWKRNRRTVVPSASSWALTISIVSHQTRTSAPTPWPTTTSSGGRVDRWASNVEDNALCNDELDIDNFFGDNADSLMYNKHVLQNSNCFVCGFGQLVEQLSWHVTKNT